MTDQIYLFKQENLEIDIFICMYAVYVEINCSERDLRKNPLY